MKNPIRSGFFVSKCRVEERFVDNKELTLRKMNMNQYLIIMKEGIDCFGAYMPDIEGCIAVAKTEQDVLTLIRKILQLKLDSLLQSGKQLPTSSTSFTAPHKTEEELNEMFLSFDPNWKPKPRKFQISYVIPADDEDREIRNLIREIEEERRG